MPGMTDLIPEPAIGLIIALVAGVLLGALACAVTVAASLVIGFELPSVLSDVAKWVERTIPR